MQPKVLSAWIVCCIWFPDAGDMFWAQMANVEDPDQAAPTVAVWSGSTLFVNEASKQLCGRERQTTFLLWSVLQGLTQTMHDVFITKPVNMCL